MAIWVRHLVRKAIKPEGTDNGCLGLGCNDAAIAADWLQWRGPLGTGHSDETTAAPAWSQTEDV